MKTMETQKLMVAETVENDISRIIEIEKSNSNFVGQYTFEEHKKVMLDNNGLHISVFDKRDNSLIGYIILLGLNNPNNSIEFRRIAISRKGLGYGKDAIKLVKSICFNKYKVHRLFLSVFSDNEVALKLYDSLGFQRDGLLRDCSLEGGRYRSMWSLSMLETEYIYDLD